MAVKVHYNIQQVKYGWGTHEVWSGFPGSGFGSFQKAAERVLNGSGRSGNNKRSLEWLKGKGGQLLRIEEVRTEYVERQGMPPLIVREERLYSYANSINWEEFILPEE